MQILIKPSLFIGCQQWRSKHEGVILVEKQEDIDPLWKLLCAQDSYWEPYKKVIQVAPKEIDSYRDIDVMCEYAGKTDIYRPAELQKLIPFIMYQRPSYDDY